MNNVTLTVHEQRRRRFSPSEIQFVKDVAAEIGALIDERDAGAS